MPNSPTFRRRSDPEDLDVRKAGIATERDLQSNQDADEDRRRQLAQFKRTDDMAAAPTRGSSLKQQGK